MTMPGFIAEAAVGGSARRYRAAGGASAGGGVRLAQSEVFCGVCALGGFGCGKVCSDCGPFGWFTCCDSVCTEPAPGFTAPATVLSR
jgi:hypothetical protein